MSDFDFLTEESEEPTEDENSSIKAIRESQKKWEKQAREYAKELKASQAKVQEFEETARKNVMEAAAKELGLKPKHLNFYDGEATLDSIKTWALENEFLEAGSVEPAKESSDGFQPGGTGGTEGSAKTGTVSREEWNTLLRTDPDRAMRLMAEQKVDVQPPQF